MPIRVQTAAPAFGQFLPTPAFLTPDDRSLVPQKAVPVIPMTMSLAEAVNLAVVETTRAYPSAALKISLSNWPQVQVRHEVHSLVQAWMMFLTETAGPDSGELHARASLRHDGWITLHLRLRQIHPPPAGNGGTTWDYSALSLVEDWGGDIQIGIQYPDVTVRLRVPSATISSRADD